MFYGDSELKAIKARPGWMEWLGYGLAGGIWQ